MASTSFAHRILLVVGFVAVLAVIFLSVEIGLCGPTAQETLRNLWHPIHRIYLYHKSAVDFSLLIVGSILSAATGGLTILKGFYYAEANLPKRLQELVERVREGHLHERPTLLAYTRGSFDTRDFLTPTILANPLAQVLRVFGFETLRTKARECASSVEQRKEEIRTIAAKREDIENRLVTGYLLRGAYHTAKAAEAPPASLEWRTHSQRSLSEYEAALDLRPADLDVLQGVVRQCQLLHDEPRELDYLNRIVANAGQNTLMHARALRLIATILNRRNHTQDWNEARAQLVMAWRLLDHTATDGSPEAAELAEALLLYGEVQVKREKLSAARSALRRARSLFLRLESEAGVAGAASAETSLKRVAELAGNSETLG